MIDADVVDQAFVRLIQTAVAVVGDRTDIGVVLHRPGQAVIGRRPSSDFQDTVGIEFQRRATHALTHSQMPLVIIGNTRRGQDVLGYVVIGDQRDVTFVGVTVFAHNQTPAMAAPGIAALADDTTLVGVAQTGHGRLVPSRDSPVLGSEIQNRWIAEIRHTRRP